mgnify:CR=1 FL=1
MTASLDQVSSGLNERLAGATGLLTAAGLEVEESTASCCGIAGTYGLKKEKFGIAMDVGAGLFAALGILTALAERERRLLALALAGDRKSVV